MSMPVTVTLPVQWGDMDALGHVNNTVYLRWFESARIAMFERIGVATTRPAGIGPILATTTCDFLIPVVYPATVEAGIRVSKVGETSITMEYEVRDASAKDKLYARGSSVIVMVEYPAMKKVRVPDAIRATIGTLPASEA